MTTKVQCSVCNGTKKTAPLGFISETCKRCEGTGFEYLVPKKMCDDILAKIEEKANGEAIIPKKEEEEKKSKRGRPKNKA